MFCCVIIPKTFVYTLIGSWDYSDPSRFLAEDSSLCPDKPSRGYILLQFHSSPFPSQKRRKRKQKQINKRKQKVKKRPTFVIRHILPVEGVYAVLGSLFIFMLLFVCVCVYVWLRLTVLFTCRSFSPDHMCN